MTSQTPCRRKIGEYCSTHKTINLGTGTGNVSNVSANSDLETLRQSLLMEERVVQNKLKAVEEATKLVEAGRSIADYSPNHSSLMSFPKNITEARAALKNLRGDKVMGFKATRYVILNNNSLPYSADVYGPTDGRPLLISVLSGFGTLNVRSGNVIIEAESGFGNVIKSHGDSKVTVIAGDGKKVSIDARDHSEVTIVPGEKSRGRAGVYDDANITIKDNGYEHSHHVSETHKNVSGDGFLPAGEVVTPF